MEALVNKSVEVEGDDVIIPPEKIAQSEAAWQYYLNGRDLGVSSKELKRKLFFCHLMLNLRT